MTKSGAFESSKFEKGESKIYAFPNPSKKAPYNHMFQLNFNGTRVSSNRYGFEFINPAIIHSYEFNLTTMIINPHDKCWVTQPTMIRYGRKNEVKEGQEKDFGTLLERKYGFHLCALAQHISYNDDEWFVTL